MFRCLGVLLVVLVAAACGGAEDDVAGSPTSGDDAPAGVETSRAPDTTADPERSPGDDGSTSPPAGPSTTAVAAAPFDRVVPTVQGGDLDLSEFAGQDLIVWFWSPW